MEAPRAREKATATLEERVADAITWFAGSMRFVYLHVVICTFLDTRQSWATAWDPEIRPQFCDLGGIGRGDLSLDLYINQTKSNERGC
jgi:hypothetical protein